MKVLDFRGGSCEGVVERTYPEAARGWHEGIYLRRNVVEKSCAPAGPQGLALWGRCVVEESEALGGDPNTISRDTYYEGMVVRIPCRACTMRIRAQVRGLDRDQTLLLVVGEEERARFTLSREATRTLELCVTLTERQVELCVVPAERCEGGTEASCELLLETLSWESVEYEPAPEPRVFIAGDSTVQTYFDDERPQAGWGERLCWYLHEGHHTRVSHDDASETWQARTYVGRGPTIFNRSLGGRSMRSYLSEHRWSRLLADVRPKDAVVIQFGLNEESATRPMRHVPPDEYATWLGRYADCVLDRQATPVFVSAPPLWTKACDPKERIAFDEYADVLRSFVTERGLPFIDLGAQALAYVRSLPECHRDVPYLRIGPFQYTSHPTGTKDVVHMSTTGAHVYAGMVARGLAEILSWVRLVDGCEEEPGAPNAVRALTAMAGRAPVGRTVDLRWKEPVGGADYYLVEKANALTGRIYAQTPTLKTSYLDTTLPGQSERVRYRVYACRRGFISEPVAVRVSLVRDDDVCRDLG